MPVALWRTGLLLSLLTVCACLEPDSVLGIVGRPVSVPCFYPELTNHVNFSIEWRREDEVVLRSEWRGDVNVEEWSSISAKLSADAALTGNLSLELPTVAPTDDNSYYKLFLVSGENHSAALCTVCLRTAASFSSPLLQRQEALSGSETAFLCHTSGGFPAPAVYWLINDTEDPPEGSVRTQAAALPGSHLYNITSQLTVNVSKDSRVSCIIENPPMNQTLTSTSDGGQGSHKIRRASEGLWIFSTCLCAVVGAMVIMGVVYQIHLDRISKRRKEQYYSQRHIRGYKRRHQHEKEAEAMKPQSRETDV